jgi:hypothetical protein
VTCENASPHSGSLPFADTEGVTGSNPVAPTRHTYRWIRRSQERLGQGDVGGAGLEPADEVRRHRVLKGAHGRLQPFRHLLRQRPGREPLSTSRATRSGWVTATHRAVKQLPEWPTRVAR